MRLDRARLTLLGLTVVFALPFIASWWLVMHPQWLPGGRSNHGALVEPPLNTGFRGGWTMVVPQEEACGAQCRRLQSVALIVQRALAPELRQATVMADCEASGKECSALARAMGRETVLLIVDPMGNAVLRYGPEVKPRDLLQDVQRLLKASSYWRNNGIG